MSMRIVRWWTGATLALLAVPAAGSAEEPVPPRAPLSFALEPLRVVRFLHTSTTEKGDAELEGLRKRAGLPAQDSKVVVRSEFSVEVLQALPDGTRSARIRFGRITATLPSVVGKPVEVASDRPLPEDPMVRMQAGGLLAMGGLTCTAVLDAGGTVAGVEVPAGAEAAIEKALRIRKGDGAFLGIALAPERIAEWVNRAWGAAPLPGREVAAGESWEVRVPSTVRHPGGELFECRVFRVASVGGGEIRVEGKGEVKVVARKIPKELAELAGTIVVKESATTSNLRLRSADGLPLTGTSETSVAYQEKRRAAPPGRLTTVRVTTAVERVESWPSKPK